MKKIEVYNDNKQTIGFVETDKDIIGSRKVVMSNFPNCGSMGFVDYIPVHNTRQCKKIADGIYSWNF